MSNAGKRVVSGSGHDAANMGGDSSADEDIVGGASTMQDQQAALEDLKAIIGQLEDAGFL